MSDASTGDRESDSGRTEPVHVRPAGGPVIASVAVPPSKSIANRALVCAALADGESELIGLAPGDDTSAMVECLGALGIPIVVSPRRPERPVDDGTGAIPTGRDVDPPPGPSRSERLTALVLGSGGDLAPGPAELPARLAGTTSRFVTAVAALGPGPYTIDGGEPLRRRPMAPLHDSLRALGASVQPAGDWGHLPVTVSGPIGATDAIVMPGDVSSQYVTALMLIAPLLPRGLRLGLSSDLVSRPYVEITRHVMAAFGVGGVEVTGRHVTVPRSHYEPVEYRVEPDASSASYPLAAAAIVGGSVAVPGLGRSSLQGDARFVDIVEAMGCVVTVADHDTVVMRRSDAALRGVDVDMSDVSDLVPTVAVLATCASSPTRIRGVGFIREKESDRLGDLADELTKVGAAVRVEDDGLTIEPVSDLHGAELDTHHDHRLAMAFGVLGLAIDDLVVNDPDVVSKSWPDYWTMLDSLPAATG